MCLQEYGDFPMLSEKKLDDLNIGSKFNITWLLAYFNQNRTILHSIVPRVAYDESSSKAYISVRLLDYTLKQRQEHNCV